MTMREVDSARPIPSSRTNPETWVWGRSETMLALLRKVERVAGMNVPVLIQGESGTGKEFLARLIHRLSPWHASRFVKLNCPAIPSELLESELFGYEKGAFTGAFGMKEGWVEQADGGTLFFDELAELSVTMQAKVLHLLQDGRFSRIGGQEDRRVDLRIICSTNRQLEQEIESGAFRKDLFYRINVVTVQLPPLRERISDIPELVAHFLCVYSGEYGCSPRPLSDKALQMMMRHSWPGNVRELENVVRRYVILGSEDVISQELLRHPQLGVPIPVLMDGSLSLKSLTRQVIRDLERKIILKALDAHNWNRRQTARALKISYRTLFYKIKQAGLPAKQASLEQRAAAAASSADRRIGGTGWS